MHRCLQLARLGAGYAAPNPLVGSVLVFGDRIIGEGWHSQYGGPHAEVHCLDSVAASDRDYIPQATMYVSLEPCAHYGKTPPCTNRIVTEGIRRVVVGMQDPFAAVNGKGIALMRDAGIEVITGILETDCKWVNRRFLTFHGKKRPYIHLKWAQTGDGFIGSGPGKRLLISGALSNRLVHRFRNEEAAILVGTQTALIDNPQLNNRLWWGRSPLRLLLDRKAKVPRSSVLFTDGNPVWVLTEKPGAVSGAVEEVHLPENAGLSGVLSALYQHQIQSVLVEGGAALLQSFFQEGLWDEAHIIINTKLQAQAGVKAPAIKGFLKSSAVLGADTIQWRINQ